MPEKGKKSLPIRETTHKEIKAEAARQGIFVTDLIDIIWDAYKTKPEFASRVKESVSATMVRKGREYEQLEIVLADPELAPVIRRTLQAFASQAIGKKERKAR